ncbi:type II restriction endonuclease [Candidatus Thiodubiliella endoseptemdiera]|uniref:type II restriction endonuclease n=1 Tax=Candidatus Thiodubiliella endoseptemdiera TaxID=2738886 RepID=UPI0034DF92F5
MKMYNFNDLKTTFQKSIFTWGYFTDFEKVKLNIKKVEIELNILNSLIGKDDIESAFISLIKQYPNIRTALPLLIATRKIKLKDTPIVSDVNTLISENKSYIFYDTLNAKVEQELGIFFDESGIKDIFQNRHIKNLIDYCFGVEVGLDSNGRKNRTGILMENIVSSYLAGFCGVNRNFSFIEQATQMSIKDNFNYDIQTDKNSRRFDFALYNNQTDKLYLIEVNYYGGGGSKLKATAGEYQTLNDFVKSQGIDFIWITDGQGWLTALNPLEETFNHNDHVINLSMLKSNALNDICK